jgi:hypothetical protein
MNEFGKALSFSGPSGWHMRAAMRSGGRLMLSDIRHALPRAIYCFYIMYLPGAAAAMAVVAARRAKSVKIVLDILLETPSNRKDSVYKG